MLSRRGFMGLFGAAIAALAAPKSLLAIAAPGIVPGEAVFALDAPFKLKPSGVPRGTYVYVQVHPLSRRIKGHEAVYWTDENRTVVHSANSWKGRINKRLAGLILSSEEGINPGNYGWVFLPLQHTYQVHGFKA